MRVYPISVPRKHYRGNKASLRQQAADYNRDAVRVETYLNERIRSSPEPIQQYLYAFIAGDVGLAVDRVRDILFAVDGGHNGLTVAKSPEALRQFLEDFDRRASHEGT